MTELSGGRPGGKLADNVVHFAHMLRRAGLPIGSGQVMDAVRAMGAVELGRRSEVFWALHATLVTRRRDSELFTQAFELFWRDPFARNEALALLLPKAQTPEPAKSDTRKRVREAHRAPPSPSPVPKMAEEEAVIDATMTFSSVEVSRTKDFEEMSAAEVRAARQMIDRMNLDVRPIVTRRFVPAEGGTHVDLRRSLRASTKGGMDGIPLLFRKRRRQPPTVVAICDISGSMERYSRLLLCFLHALTGARERVHSFVFGTRLWNATRALRERDVDIALDRLGSRISDWSGGTRIGRCLRSFNRDWSRRVLAPGAIVLLITDGLDRDAEVDLGFEADRLHRSCRRLIWLNPLLRYRGFEPRARGIVELLPHVDEHRPVHNLDSLEQLARVLS